MPDLTPDPRPLPSPPDQAAAEDASIKAFQAALHSNIHGNRRGDADVSRRGLVRMSRVMGVMGLVATPIIVIGLALAYPHGGELQFNNLIAAFWGGVVTVGLSLTLLLVSAVLARR